MNIEQRIQELEAQLAELKAEMTAQDEKWEPPGGGFQVNSEGDVIACYSSIEPTRAYGVEFQTREAAEKAAIAYRKYHRLYQLAQQLNEGWEPDWLNGTQEKHLIYYSAETKDWSVRKSWGWQSFYGVAFKDWYTAKKAIELIKQGALT